MGEPRMARIDVVLHLGKKAGKVKEEKYLYSIFSKDFPKGPGNPVYGSGEVKDTTANRMALQCLVDALQRIHRPSLLTVHTTSGYLQNGYRSLPEWKENGWTRKDKKELRNADLWQQADKLLSNHAVRFNIPQKLVNTERRT